MNSPDTHSTVVRPGSAGSAAEASATSAIGTDRAPATSAINTARVIVARAAANYRHSPGLFAIALAAPLGMMLLFGFVFGGALAGGDDPAAYRSYLMPGVLVLVAAMGLATTANIANADLHSGLTDRFRVLPVPRIGVPAGLALAETVIGVLALAVMAGVGMLVGWRIDASTSDLALAVALLIAFRLALSWLGISLGLAIRDEQILQQAAPMIFGAIMFSNVFTPTETMPTVVRAIAEWNPISAVVAALRELLGSGGAVAADAAWPLQHPVAAAFGWIAVFLIVTIPLAVHRYSAQR